MDQVQKQKIIQQIKQHKKAILYSFFRTTEDLNITKLEPKTQGDHITKAIVSFEQEKKVIYDSGSLVLEQEFVKYITWFNQNILKDRKMYCKRILSYPDCGFIEYIDVSDCQNEKQKKEYYYRLGSLDALLLPLQSEELTVSNIKMVKEQPIVQDIRALLRKPLVYNRRWEDDTEKRQYTHKNITNKYLDSMEKGYEDTCYFIQKNEQDVEEIIKLCFSGKETWST